MISLLLLKKKCCFLTHGLSRQGRDGKKQLLLCEKDMLFHREQEFCDTVAQIFSEKQDIFVSVSVDFTLEVEQKKNKGCEVYTRTAQGLLQAAALRI